jgi:hypothetical protein
MNLAQEITETLAKEMQESIDFEIRSDILCRFGWTRFDISRYIDNDHAVDITYWLEDNCFGEYKRDGRKFLFEDSKDATMFILRWGS